MAIPTFAQGLFRQDPDASPASLQRRREMLMSLMPQYGNAQYAGEGLGQMFTGLARGAAYRRLDKAEDKERQRIRGLFGGLLPGGAGASVSAPSYAPAARPTGPNEKIADDTMATLIRTGLVDRGLPEHVAQGFVTNFGDESGFDPTINEASPIVPGSRGGFGLAQWTGPRRVALEQYAASQGKPVGDMNTQLDFLMSELKGPEASAAQSIMAAPDANSAAVAVARDFLRPAPANLERRVADYGGSAPAVNTLDIATLAEIAASPYAEPGMKIAAQTLMQQQMQNLDPMRQMEMDRARLELEAMRNPKPPEQKQTDDMREYEFARSQGYQGNFTDFQTDMRKAGASSVTVNGDTGPQVGTIPQGYQLTQDPASGAFRMEAIPGGPEDKSANAAARTSQNATASDTVTTAAARARTAAQQRDFGSLGTTIVGRFNPLSDSAEVMRNVSVLKSQASIGNLQAMRDASPTGGALGNVTEQELKILQDKSGALDPNSPTFTRDLDDYERTLLRTIHGKDEGDRVFAETRGGDAPAGGGTGRQPTVINGYTIEEAD